MIFPEAQLSAYLGFFIPKGQVEPLLDRIAEVSSEMEELDLVGFLHLAQRELELTGDMNRDDAAVVLIEELQLPLAEAAAVLEETPATTAARIQSAWAGMPENQPVEGVASLSDGGPILFDGDIELDSSLSLDPTLVVARSETPYQEESFTLAPDTPELESELESGRYVPQNVSTGECYVPQNVSPEGGAELVESGGECYVPQNVSPEGGAELVESGGECYVPQNVSPEGGAELVESGGECYVPQNVSTGEEIPAPKAEAPPLLPPIEPVDFDVPAPDADVPTPQAPGSDVPVSQEASPVVPTPDGPDGASRGVPEEPELVIDRDATQAFDPYLALAPEYIEESALSFPWNPHDNGHPVTAASLLALDDVVEDLAPDLGPDLGLDLGASEAESEAITQGDDEDIWGQRSAYDPDESLPEPPVTGDDERREHTQALLESEILAAALMAASARGDAIEFEEPDTETTGQITSSPIPPAQDSSAQPLADVFGVDAPSAPRPDPETQDATQQLSLADIMAQARLDAQRAQEHQQAGPTGEQDQHDLGELTAQFDPVTDESSAMPMAMTGETTPSQQPITSQAEAGPSDVPPLSPSVQRFLSDLNVAWIAGGHDVLKLPASAVPLGGRFEIAEPPPAKARKRPLAAGAALTNDDAVTATYEEEPGQASQAQIPPPAAVWIPGMAERAFRDTPWRYGASEPAEDDDLHGFGTGIGYSSPPAPAPSTTTQVPNDGRVHLGDAAAFMADGPAPAPYWDDIEEGSWLHADYGPKRPKANRLGQIAGLIALAIAAGVMYLFFSWAPLKAGVQALGLPIDPLIIVGSLAGVLGVGGLSMFIGSSIPKRSKTKVLRRRRKTTHATPVGEEGEYMLDQGEEGDIDLGEPSYIEAGFSEEEDAALLADNREE